MISDLVAESIRVTLVSQVYESYSYGGSDNSLKSHFLTPVKKLVVNIPDADADIFRSEIPHGYTNGIQDNI